MLSDDGTRSAHSGGGEGRDQPRRAVALSAHTQDHRNQVQRTAALMDDPVAQQEAMKSQTCVEFLHIMKEFSESSCNASETVQRVDSLVHQDEHLLRLFPLSKEQDGGKQIRQDRDEQEPDDEECKSTDEDNSMNGDEDEEAESMDVDSEARNEVRNSDKRLQQDSKNDSAMDDTQDELDRWIELDLEFDHQMDVFDFNLDQGSTSGATAPELTAQSVFGKHAAVNGTSVLADSNGMHEAGKYLATTGSSNPTAANALGVTIRSSLPASSFDKKSMTAALFEYDDEDDEESIAARSPLLKSRAVLERQLSAVEREDETKDDETNVWGRADDEYQQDLLSNIDHAVLCDRENRFLQWGLEMEAQQQQQLLSTPPAASPMAQSFSRRLSMENGVTGATSAPADHLRLVMASSPREKMAKSPSNVDIVDDWSSLDFGTFQNRTVSHILSSCLHKRKLQHPYKNQVKLVNFHIPPAAEGNGEGIEKLQPHLGGSLATSLAFGTQQDDGLSGSVGAESVLGSRFMSTLGDVDATAPPMVLGGAKPGSNAVAKGERKPKKREERKRLMVQKMQDTFADFEVAFTEQELDVKGIHSGPMSKMALSKLENLPLPDLTNLPHDLRELKRKIDATEHKVEGTKHRHRKGGPCPRCQVQNQLRAAKRAYHKRAVAHKKLPQILANSNGSASSAASIPVGATATTSPLRVGIPAASLAGTSAGAGSKGLVDQLRNGTKPSLPVSVVLPGSGTVSSINQPATTGAGVRALAHNAVDQKFASANAAGGSSLVVSVGGSSSSNASSTGLMHQRHHLVNGNASNVQLVSAPTSFQARARRPCGNAASSFPSPSSSVTSSSSASTPSSPETQPPQVQHVTVSSA